MEQQFERTSLLYGKENIDKLKNKHVAIFGVGGVGGYVVESLIRSGIGHISIFDNDVVSITNINRQIIALYSTIGQYKVDVLKKRILDINPNCVVHAYKMFVDENNINDIDFSQFDYVVDAIDTVKSKIAIIKKCHDENIKILSSMGAGNKNNPMGFIISDINQTEYDPLAKAIRQKLRKINIKHLKVCYSKEMPLKIINNDNNDDKNKKVVPGSNAFVPSSCGLLIAKTVFFDLMEE